MARRHRCAPREWPISPRRASTTSAPSRAGGATRGCRSSLRRRCSSAVRISCCWGRPTFAGRRSTTCGLSSTSAPRPARRRWCSGRRAIAAARGARRPTPWRSRRTPSAARQEAGGRGLLAIEANPTKCGDFMRPCAMQWRSSTFARIGFRLHLDHGCMTMAGDAIDSRSRSGRLTSFRARDAPNLAPVDASTVGLPAFVTALEAAGMTAGCRRNAALESGDLSALERSAAHVAAAVPWDRIASSAAFDFVLVRIRSVDRRRMMRPPSGVSPGPRCSRT